MVRLLFFVLYKTRAHCWQVPVCPTASRPGASMRTMSVTCHSLSPPALRPLTCLLSLVEQTLRSASLRCAGHWKVKQQFYFVLRCALTGSDLLAMSYISMRTRLICTKTSRQNSQGAISPRTSTSPSLDLMGSLSAFLSEVCKIDSATRTL